ncbi:MAG: hypothetical protein ACHQZS_12405 [Candidatus Binatales bacterium]
MGKCVATRIGIRSRLSIGMVSAALIVTALSFEAVAAEDSAAATAGASDTVELASEMRALRAEVADLRQQVGALRAQLAAAPERANPPLASEAGAPAPAPGGVAPPGGVTPPGESAPGEAPPPGVTPSGQEAPAGTTLGGALKQLLPGPVSPPPAAGGYAAGHPQGVIVPGLEGVSKVFIPDIGGVGDFLFQQSDLRKGDPRYDPANDKFNVRDTQLIFFSPIDPYTLAQISIDKPDNGAFDIEEAFLVFNQLPEDLTLRAGQFRPHFGLINEIDTFQLPVVNRPQAIARYIGDDGFVEPGVNLNGYIPNPWDADIKADVNLLSGYNTLSFDHRDGRNFDFAFIGNLIYSRDLFDSGFLTSGASFAGGPGPGGQSYLEDAFAQVRYIPSQRQVLTVSTEGLLAEREGVNDHGVKRGVYSLVDYNFWLRYHLGLLLDLADVPNVPRGTEFGVSPLFTYFVSDNTRLRLQYTHTTGSDAERADDVVLLQATFSLGNLKPLE